MKNSKVPPGNPETDFRKLFARLEGDWKLVRCISDGSRLIGSASFSTRGEDCLLLEEAGELVRDDEHYPASRRWLWQLGKRPASLDICFDETVRRDYHALKFNEVDGAWHATGQHYCGKDVYQGEYRFSEDALFIKQSIAGPNKNLLLESRYLRLP